MFVGILVVRRKKKRIVFAHSLINILPIKFADGRKKTHTHTVDGRAKEWTTLDGWWVVSGSKGGNGQLDVKTIETLI
jgi:hypothetical protein